MVKKSGGAKTQIPTSFFRVIYKDSLIAGERAASDTINGERSRRALRCADILSETLTES